MGSKLKILTLMLFLGGILMKNVKNMFILLLALSSMQVYAQSDAEIIGETGIVHTGVAPQ